MNLVKKLLAKVDLKISRISSIDSRIQRTPEEKWADQFSFLTGKSFQTVLDLGAHRGEFAKMINHACQSAPDIHSFEPLKGCQDDLKRALGGYCGHFVHPLAIGDTSGGGKLFRCEDTRHSSILPPNPTFTKWYPHAGRFIEETVQFKRLDDWAEDYPLTAPMLIWMDVNGAERHIIQGASETLCRASIVVIKMPFFVLYEGQPTFNDILAMLFERNFRFGGCTGQFIGDAKAPTMDFEVWFTKSDRSL